MNRLPFLVVIVAALCGPAVGQQSPVVFDYSGMCDASAAVSVGPGMFIVANDEDNVLRIYRRGEPDVKQNFPFDSFLKTTKKHREADMEGAARIGDDIYWIGSHGQNKDGKDRPNRHRLFATTVKTQDAKVAILPVGSPYFDLRADLIAAPQLAKYKLGAAAKLAPKEPGAFNIEGLAATPDGRLLVGFRNPITDGKALIVPIDNPKDVINGKKAQIGMPIELALEGRGIRSIEFSVERNRYFLVAGPIGGGGAFALYTWSGQPKEKLEPVQGIDFGSLNPEALFFEPGDKAGVHILSDDGDRKINGQTCKDMDPKAQRFRGISLTLQ